MDRNAYDFLGEIKEDIKHWWKTNMLNCQINKKEVFFRNFIEN